MGSKEKPALLPGIQLQRRWIHRLILHMRSLRLRSAGCGASHLQFVQARLNELLASLQSIPNPNCGIHYAAVYLPGSLGGIIGTNCPNCNLSRVQLQPGRRRRVSLRRLLLNLDAPISSDTWKYFSEFRTSIQRHNERS
jgi:hypothetical protein